MSSRSASKGTVIVRGGAPHTARSLRVDELALGSGCWYLDICLPAGVARRTDQGIFLLLTLFCYP